MRMAGRFARRVRAWATANGVPVIDCKAGERKHEIAEEYLAGHVVRRGVFLILVAGAGLGVEVNRSAGGAITSLQKKTEYVNHYCFHIMDRDWGTWSSRCPGIRRSAVCPETGVRRCRRSPTRTVLCQWWR